MASNRPTVSISEATPHCWWKATESIVAAEKLQVPRPGTELPGGRAVWLVARRGSRVVGACRGELAPGQAAAVFPPLLSDGEPIATGRVLLQTLEEKITGAHPSIHLLHALACPALHLEAETLQAAGFKLLGEVFHMACSTQTAAPAGEPHLEFEPLDDSPSSRNRLLTVYERTCCEALDFPEAWSLEGGPRPLEGYRDVGRFRTGLWQFATLEGRDVGCLLVSELPEADLYQLVFCGLIPSVRDRGFGAELGSKGLQLAKSLGAKQLVLSVDRRNTAAIRAYKAAGFFVTDQSWLLVKRARRLSCQ